MGTADAQRESLETETERVWGGESNAFLVALRVLIYMWARMTKTTYMMSSTAL